MESPDPARVLIADADPALRRQVYAKLLDRNVFSDAVGDGKSALQKLRESTYAVVVLDLNLPVVSAERLVEVIGSWPDQRRPVVLVMAAGQSARSLDIDVVQVVLRKPVNISQLTDVVCSCVRATAAAQPESLTGGLSGGLIEPVA